MAAKPPCDSLLVTHLPNIRFLTGFTGSSGCALVTRRRKLFFTDSRYTVQAKRQVRGFQTVIANGPPLIAACAYIARRRISIGVLGYEGAHLSSRELAAARRTLKGVSFKDASGCVEQQRARKSRTEIARIRKACALADKAMQRLRRSRVTGRTEREVAWMLETMMRESGSEALPFEIIVASGPRSSMPHGLATDRVIGSGELIVVDLGARVEGYCSDMTRTFATGALSARQEEIYRIVQEAQRLGVAAARPGAKAARVDEAAREYIDAAGYGDAFGHSAGHGVGLEAHELPVLAARSTDLLEAGMTVTVEPGIYLERTGGVRIEDTVLVGVRGPETLTRFPRELIRLK